MAAGNTGAGKAKPGSLLLPPIIPMPKNNAYKKDFGIGLTHLSNDLKSGLLYKMIIKPTRGMATIDITIA